MSELMTDDIQVICEVIKDDSISIAEDQLFAVPKSVNSSSP